MVGMDFLGPIPPKMPSNRSCLHLAGDRHWMTRLYNQMISERDWSAQEVCHLLLGLGLRQGSRSVADLDIRPNSVQRRRLHLDEATATLDETWIERYPSRNETLDDVSLNEHHTRLHLA